MIIIMVSINKKCFSVLVKVMLMLDRDHKEADTHISIHVQPEGKRQPEMPRLNCGYRFGYNLH